jgi:hypothetical protein
MIGDTLAVQREAIAGRGKKVAKKKWIAGAIKHPGAFKRKAQAAGMSTSSYAQKEEGAPGILGRQARLAITLGRMRGR